MSGETTDREEGAALFLELLQVSAKAQVLVRDGRHKPEKARRLLELCEGWIDQMDPDGGRDARWLAPLDRFIPDHVAKHLRAHANLG